MVQHTIAATSRSTLELLSLPFPFSQVDLLQPSEFVKAAAERQITMWGGRDLDVSALEELHRLGILVPFYCVNIDDDPTGEPIDISASLTAQHVHGGIVAEMYQAAAGGRLTDPAAESFAPWPTEGTRTLRSTVQRRYLYSYHQLLTLYHARSIVASMRPRWFPNHRQESFLPDHDLPDEHAFDGLRSWRDLAIALCAIDTRVWPGITQVVHHNVEVWRAANIGQEPAELAMWLGLTAEQLRQQSDRLRANASFKDVLGDFYDVVRRAKAEAWMSLRGDARPRYGRTDRSRGAGSLCRRLGGCHHRARPGPPERLSHQGLSRRRHSLDGVLTVSTCLHILLWWWHSKARPR